MPVGEFNQEAFQGAWFDMFKDNGMLFGDQNPCGVTEFTESGMITHQSMDAATGNVGKEEFPVRFDENGNGYIKYHPLLPETNYQVIDTDYVQYAVVYGCNTWLFGYIHTEVAWLLSREDTISEYIEEKARNQFAEEVSFYNINA